jgi:serine protease AprX
LIRLQKDSYRSMSRFSSPPLLCNKLLIALIALVSLAFKTPLFGQEMSRSDLTPSLIVFPQISTLSEARHLRSKTEKGRLVYQQLQYHARASQSRVRQWLEEGGYVFRPFCVANVIYAELDDAMADRLSRLEEVVAIQANPVFRMPEVGPEPSMDQARDLELPWGITLIGADQVWAMGYRGQGVVIGSHDTGVEWSHPALIRNYRGWNGSDADHHYHWHDAIHQLSPLHQDSVITDTTNPCGLSITIPCDDAGSSHGTHTTGTMAGYDEAEGIMVGVAPDAQWIAVRNMERGYGSLATYLEGFEWFLAPTDLNNEHPDPDKAPHIINNSWACVDMEGCNPGNFSILEAAISNLRMAGILVVASAGNSGSQGCASISNPPAIYEASLTVGSVDASDSLSSFSSRGPVPFEGFSSVKPNVTAPGRGVLSAIRGGGYGTLSGTSMAGPHVSGLAALILSARPDLAGQVDAIEAIIERTAVPKEDGFGCSSGLTGSSPNMAYGSGRIDAMAAVLEALNTTTLVEETLVDDGWFPYPNPASNQLFIRFPGTDTQATLVIFDATGRKIYQNRDPGPEVVIDVSQWPAGIYAAQILQRSAGVANKLFLISR